jgi:hypothetical protein
VKGPRPAYSSCLHVDLGLDFEIEGLETSFQGLGGVEEKLSTATKNISNQ